MPKSFERKELVICGDYAEYQDFLRRKVIPFEIAFKLGIKPKYIYVKENDLNALHGIEISGVQLFGTWKRRRDLISLQEELQVIYNPNFKFPL